MQVYASQEGRPHVVIEGYMHSPWQVFLFCANDKGASWAYATPGFGASLGPAHLKMMRQMAMPDIDEAAKVCCRCIDAASMESGSRARRCIAVLMILRKHPNGGRGWRMHQSWLLQQKKGCERSMYWRQEMS